MSERERVGGREEGRERGRGISPFPRQKILCVCFQLSVQVSGGQDWGRKEIFVWKLCHPLLLLLLSGYKVGWP